MNKELRRVSIVVLMMFIALFGSSTVIQVFQQDNLKADSRNVRTLYASFSAERATSSTSAPAAAARAGVARPIPDEAPVISTFNPRSPLSITTCAVSRGRSPRRT